MTSHIMEYARWDIFVLKFSMSNMNFMLLSMALEMFPSVGIFITCPRVVTVLFATATVWLPYMQAIYIKVSLSIDMLST